MSPTRDEGGGATWSALRDKAFSDFQSNQFSSTHARHISDAIGLVHWLMFSLGLRKLKE